MSDETTREVQEADLNRVSKAIADLLPYFDTVQIFVTRLEPDGNTMSCSDGKGNWYSRFGQVREWLDNGGAMHVDEKGEG